MPEAEVVRYSRFGDDTEDFLRFYETEPLKDQEEIAKRLRLLETEEPETEGD